MIAFEARGDFKKLDKFLAAMQKGNMYKALEKYGRAGVSALSSMTPTESGQTAASWGYEIKRTGGSYSIVWTNSNIVAGVPIAIILQYGHGTGTGGYVAGRDYINPAIKPVMDKIAADVWKEVTKA